MLRGPVGSNHVIQASSNLLTWLGMWGLCKDVSVLVTNSSIIIVRIKTIRSDCKTEFVLSGEQVAAVFVEDLLIFELGQISDVMLEAWRKDQRKLQQPVV
jgi:hypothetical protein